MIYLIDTENVPYEWINRFKELGMDRKDSQIIIAYTDKSSKLSYDQISFLLEQSTEAKIGFTKCKNGKPNALDFHIIGTITAFLLQDREEQYVIVSNDTGFDTFIDKLNDTSVSVSRLSCEAKETSTETAKEDSKEIAKVSDTDEVRKLQRAFLTEQCGVPPTLAEMVRKALIVGIDEAVSKIHASKSKALAGHDELKEQLSERITGHYDEYLQVGIVQQQMETEPEEAENTKAQNKKLFKKQRDYLHKNCGVPSTFTEPVRQYLMSDKAKAFERIMQSKAKPIKGNKTVKQNIIKKIESHYDEYMAIKAD